MFSKSSSQHYFIALPFKSAPEEADVGCVFEQREVFVLFTWMYSSGIYKASAHTIAILVCRLCPISVPLWFTATDPSLYMCTNAEASFMKFSSKLTEFFRGEMAIPRLMKRFFSLNSDIYCIFFVTSTLDSSVFNKV